MPLSRDLVPAGRSPDGRLAGFFDYRHPALRVVDLEAMRVRGDVRLASSQRWRARGAAWLTADRVAVVLQRMRGAYNQIVDRREVVIVVDDTYGHLVHGSLDRVRDALDRRARREAGAAEQAAADS